MLKVGIVNVSGDGFLSISFEGLSINGFCGISLDGEATDDFCIVMIKSGGAGVRPLAELLPLIFSGLSSLEFESLTGVGLEEGCPLSSSDDASRKVELVTGICCWF